MQVNSRTRDDDLDLSIEGSTDLDLLLVLLHLVWGLFPSIRQWSRCVLLSTLWGGGLVSGMKLFKGTNEKMPQDKSHLTPRRDLWDRLIPVLLTVDRPILVRDLFPSVLQEFGPTQESSVQRKDGIGKPRNSQNFQLSLFLGKVTYH